MNRLTLLAALAALHLAFVPRAAAGDGHDHADEEAALEAETHDAADFEQTRWTDGVEAYLRHGPLWSYSSAHFDLALTHLSTQKPIDLDAVELVFTGATGERSEFRLEAVAPGVYARSIGLKQAGDYALELHLRGSDLPDAIRLDDVTVAASEEAVVPPAAAAEPPTWFGKQQQWMLPFATTVAEERQILQSVWAIGTVLPAPTSYIEIVAPADGLLEAVSAADLALPGARVEAGDVLVTIAPSLTGGGWLESRQAFAQAEREWQRARRLREHDAIAQSDFERLRDEYQVSKAAHDRLAATGRDDLLTLTAPIAGQIVEWRVRPGRRVQAGDPLMAVADMSTVWLQIDVYEKDYRDLGTPSGLYVGPAGRGWTVPAGDLRVLSRGGALEPATRTVPVLLEIANPAGRLHLNETTPVELYAGDGTRATAVPRSAVVEDGGVPVVFVQTGGESFVRRPVRLGPTHGDWVSILEGVEPGERIVSRGGYHVMLSSTTAEIGHGHAH